MNIYRCTKNRSERCFCCCAVNTHVKVITIGGGSFTNRVVRSFCGFDWWRWWCPWGISVRQKTQCESNIKKGGTYIVAYLHLCQVRGCRGRGRSCRLLLAARGSQRALIERIPRLLSPSRRRRHRRKCTLLLRLETSG